MSQLLFYAYKHNHIRNDSKNTILKLLPCGCRHDGRTQASNVPTDVPSDQLKELVIRCYSREVVVDSEKANSIELTTRNHSRDDDESVVWLSERRRRITSSNVRSIAKRRSTTPVAHMVNELLYSTFRGNSATRCRLEQEQHSVSVYTSWLRDRD